LPFPSSYGSGRWRISPTPDVVAGLRGLLGAAPDQSPRREQSRFPAPVLREVAVVDRAVGVPPSGRAGGAAQRRPSVPQCRPGGAPRGSRRVAEIDRAGLAGPPIEPAVRLRRRSAPAPPLPLTVPKVCEKLAGRTVDPLTNAHRAWLGRGLLE